MALSKEQQANLYSARWAIRELLEVDPKSEKLKFAEGEISEALGQPAVGEVITEPVPVPIIPTPVLNKSQATLGVVVGHTKKDGGATFALGGSEYQYNTQVAKLMTEYAKQVYPNLQVATIFRDGIGIAGAYRKIKELFLGRKDPDVAIELHFNAANRKAVGTETLSTTEALDKAYSAIVQAHMCRTFGRSGMSRGVKVLKSGDRGAGNIYSLPGFANCLVEPFFGDNPSEAALAKQKQEAYARCLVDASMEYLTKLGLK